MASSEGDVIAVSNDWNESGSFVNGTCSGEWNDTDCYDSNFWRHSDVVTAVYCVAYSIVFVVGLVGNFFVISVVCRAPRMKTVTNLFIANLAVADILVILLVLPGTLLSAIFVPWILGDLMCKLVAYISGVSVVASVYSLLAVTADRFFAICYPMKFQVTKRRARVILVFTWILALTVTSPWLIYFQQVPAYSDRNDTLLCVEQWPHPDDGNAYFLVANLFFCYIFPITVILFCYITIFLRVFNRAIPSDTKDNHMERIQQRSKVRVIKMLVVIIVIFALSWLPLYIIFCRVKLFPVSDNEQEILAIAAPISQWLGLSNSCINPIVYAFFNDKFRKGFIAIIKSRSCWSRLRLEQSIRTNTMAIETTTVRYTASRASRKVSFAGESAQML